MVQKNLLITGGAGFIGSHLTEAALVAGHRVVVLDKLTYAGNLQNLAAALRYADFRFVKGDIGDAALIGALLREHAIDQVLHLAAETHVDNSINGPEAFVQTNVLGTSRLLEAVRGYLQEQPQRREQFRCVNVSTDEVYGALRDGDAPFCETTPFAPNSPYSASKAGADFLARAWFHTYGLPIITTHCSNNYGPRQHAEKLIPTMIRNALSGATLPMYGDGSNRRDWLYVGDHCAGILLAAERGVAGQDYCFGGGCEMSNLDLVRQICVILDRLAPSASGQSYAAQIGFVNDRPGHDWRYAVDASKAQQALGFNPRMDFAAGLELTVRALQQREPAQVA